MRLAALTTGAGVPENGFAGITAAVYSRACLVALSDDALLTLVTPELGSLPRGITINAPPGFSFEAILGVGVEVTVRAGILRIEGGRLSVDLRRSQRWRSNLRELELDLDRPGVAQSWQAAWSALRTDAVDISLVRIGHAAISALDEATRAMRITAASHAVSRLIGLGEGLTPAGDDYLVGYLAALWSSAGRTGARADFVAEIGVRLRALASRTHRVSRAYLEAASEGEVSERLAVLAGRIAAAADAEQVHAATAAALAVGHCSGAHGALGLLLGCAAWGRDDFRRVCADIGGFGTRAGAWA
jgi:Protein of unknown function (DUF2877)